MLSGEFMDSKSRRYKTQVFRNLYITFLMLLVGIFVVSRLFHNNPIFNSHDRGRCADGYFFILYIPG